MTREVLQRWGSDLARPVVAGFLLLVVEAGVVAATGGDLFLDAGEPLRYLAAALPLLVCLCVTGWALASIVLRASGAARPVPRRAPIGPVARRAGLAAAAIAAPVTALALYLVSDGRRLRDVPGRPFLVVLGGLSVGALLFWIVARLVRKARAGETRELRAFAAFAAGVALAAVVADATLLRRLYPSLHWTLSGVALSGALLAAAAWPARVTGGVKVFVLSVVFFAAAPLSVWLLRDASNASFVVERSAPLTGKVVRALRRGGDGLGTAGPRPEPTPRAAPTAGIDLRDRDVLLVTVDALRADRLRALGGSGIAPHMDALAAEGALFRRAYSSTPTTSYAVGSLLTGKYLEAAMDLADAPREHPTIAELLARHGYQTAAFYPPAIFFVDEERFADMEADGFGFAHREVGFTGADARVADASAWLREASPDAPVFVWAHFFEPHEPYDPPDGYERGATLAERYDGEVAAVDNALAELVAAFRRERPGATIILTADHGEELGDHGGHYHGTTLYDEQVRIPLIWSSPGVVEPAVYDVPVDLPDIATTLLAALGVPRDARMRGDDLGPVLGGHPDLGPSHAFAVVGDEHMATDGLLKAICAIGAEGCRLYDLVRDPEERRNLGTEREADVARLRGALSQHLSSIPSGEMRARREGGPPPELARAELGDPTVGPELVPLLGSEDPEVRAAAAPANARGRHLPAAPVLARMRAEDPDEAVRAEAAVTALRLGDEEALAQVRDLTRGADPASPVARRGAIALGERGDPAAVPLLIALAADPEAEEPRRADAIELLGELGSPRALPVLTALLSDLRLRILAADALGRIGDRRAGRPLAQALEREPYIPARVAEAEALVRLADRRAEPLIRRFLGTPTPLPGGVRMLRDLRALRETTGRGAELQRSPRALEGSWECDDAGCRPGEGAAILLPVARAPREEARAVVLTVALSDGAALVLDGERRVLRAGAQELAFDAQPSTERRRFDVVIEGDVRIVAIVVVPPEEDLLVQE